MVAQHGSVGPSPTSKPFEAAENSMKVFILTHIKKCPVTGNNVLIQDRVFEILETDDFDEVRQLVLDVLPYPKPQSNKYETYSWLPAECSFVTKTYEDGSEHTYRRRSADTCAEEVCVLILDIDNELHEKKRNLGYRYVQAANSPVLSENTNYDPELWEFCASKAGLSLSDIKERLAQLRINHFWYTSYSHTNEKAKVRVVLELSRPITWNEARKLGALVSFDHPPTERSNPMFVLFLIALVVGGYFVWQDYQVCADQIAIYNASLWASSPSRATLNMMMDAQQVCGIWNQF